MLTLCPTTGINHSSGNRQFLHINAERGFPARFFGGRRKTSRTMRAAVTLLLLLLTTARAEHRGRAYVRDKVCQEFKTLGKDQFRTLKYSNATFEEINHLVHEIVSLAETCCAEGTDPSCYDAGHLVQWHWLSPTHLCCRFLYEYASSYSQAPLPVLLGSTRTFLSMVSTCCISPAPTVCFLKEKLERKNLSLLTLMSNRVCSRFMAYGKDKVTFSYLAMLAQKTPGASFEDLFPLAEDAAEVFSQCCDSVAEDCMQKKLSEHTTKICSVLSAQDQRLADCCQGKNIINNYFCISALQPAPSPRLPEPPKPTNKQLCGEDGARHVQRYLFELGRRHTSVPDIFLGKLYDASEKVIRECCSAKDVPACLDSKRQQMDGELPPFLEKANQLCGEYNKLNFLDFKKKLRESLMRTTPDASPEQLGLLVEQRAEFASTCCPATSPPLYCTSKVSVALGNTCKGGSCLLV
ncbi:Gc [Columba guinea]|nr:Gc [Columba guinea]